jgi:lipid-A-disaccharide synthase
MKILISAAETSSDGHGAELLKAIQEQLRSQKLAPADAFGIGGPKLQAQGFHTVIDTQKLSAMGFVEVLSHLPRIFKVLAQITQVAKERKPDVAIVIDFPDFHFRLAHRLKKMGVPIVYYIPPKVWVWRKGRTKILKKLFDRILCIFPFEEDFYRKENIPAKYVGNPLVDVLPLALSKADARKSLTLNESQKVVVLMPGSRSFETEQHLQLMLDSTREAAIQLKKSGHLKSDEKLEVLLPFPVTANLKLLEEKVTAWQKQTHPTDLHVRVSQGNSAECLVAADAALVKSGTSTLEAALLRCPHVLVYKVNPVSYWAFKYLVRYRGPVGLANLIFGWKPNQEYLVREVVGNQVTQEELKKQLVALLTDESLREKLSKGFEVIREKICGDEGSRFSPSHCAALEIIEIAQRSAEIRQK